MLFLPWSSSLRGPSRAAIRPAFIIARSLVCALISPPFSGAVHASNAVETRADFSPGVVRRDENGSAINAHGEGVTFFEGTYYWYGEHKVPGKNDSHPGDLADGGVHAYSSTDLVRWKDEGIVLPVQENDPQRELAYGCTLERPKVLFNERTRTFVMFFKYYLIDSGSSGWKPNAAHAFVADSISAPYESTGNPCAGENPHLGLGPDPTFGGQISFLLPVKGKREAFIGMFDIWKPDAPSEGLYAWLPVTLEEGKPVVSWRTYWTLSAFDEMQTRTK